MNKDTDRVLQDPSSGQQDPEETPSKEYTTPELREYGTVRELTQTNPPAELFFDTGTNINVYASTSN